MPHLPLGPLSSTARREESFQRRVRPASQYLTGEQIAIGVLRDPKLMYNETFGGDLLTTFGGAKMII
ncbi:MAG TPA: hypothetical protein VEG60_13680 [Candidatus Binatia bacterium]|nr:hypothetical protein [Candidatus Binatia bacterium]